MKPSSSLCVSVVYTCRPFAFNLSSAYVCTEFKDLMRQIIEYADFVFCNRAEARAFACAQRLPADSVADIARLVASLPKKNGSRSRIVVITNGSQPTVVFENGVVHRYGVLHGKLDGVYWVGVSSRIPSWFRQQHYGVEFGTREGVGCTIEWATTCRIALFSSSM